MSFNILTEHLLEFLSLKGGCTGSSESILVKMPHCWKSHGTAHISLFQLVSVAQQAGVALTIDRFSYDRVRNCLTTTGALTF